MSTMSQFETKGEPFIFPDRLNAKATLLSQVKISKEVVGVELVQYDTDQSTLNRLIAMAERDELSETNVRFAPH